MPVSVPILIDLQTTSVGPCLGPIISGFISTVSWRWTFWVGFIFAVISAPGVIFMPETYAPVLLHAKAKKLRKETGNINIVSQSEIDPKTWHYVGTVVLMRPIKMIVHESIVLFSCLFLALAYAIFYILLQAYPRIFEGPDSKF